MVALSPEIEGQLGADCGARQASGSIWRRAPGARALQLQVAGGETSARCAPRRSRRKRRSPFTGGRRVFAIGRTITITRSATSPGAARRGETSALTRWPASDASGVTATFSSISPGFQELDAPGGNARAPAQRGQHVDS